MEVPAAGLQRAARKVRATPVAQPAKSALGAVALCLRSWWHGPCNVSPEMHPPFVDSDPRLQPDAHGRARRVQLLARMVRQVLIETAHNGSVRSAALSSCRSEAGQRWIANAGWMRVSETVHVRPRRLNRPSDACFVPAKTHGEYASHPRHIPHGQGAASYFYVLPRNGLPKSQPTVVFRTPGKRPEHDSGRTWGESSALVRNVDEHCTGIAIRAQRDLRLRAGELEGVL